VKVKELLESLQNVDPEAEVLTVDYTGGAHEILKSTCSVYRKGDYVTAGDFSSLPEVVDIDDDSRRYPKIATTTVVIIYQEDRYE
jgi:hypothetical protein